jgi:hypothetical protein
MILLSWGGTQLYVGTSSSDLELVQLDSNSLSFNAVYNSPNVGFFGIGSDGFIATSSTGYQWNAVTGLTWEDFQWIVYDENSEKFFALSKSESTGNETIWSFGPNDIWTASNLTGDGSPSSLPIYVPNIGWVAMVINSYGGFGITTSQDLVNWNITFNIMDSIYPYLIPGTLCTDGQYIYAAASDQAFDNYIIRLEKNKKISSGVNKTGD